MTARHLVALVACAAAATSFVPSPARAAGTVDQGWWSEVRQNGVNAADPRGDPGNVHVANDPFSLTLPGQLTTASLGTREIAALRFAVPDQLAGSSVDPSSVAVDVRLHEVTAASIGTGSIVACRALGQWAAVNDGEWGQRPAYVPDACSTPAAPDRDGLVVLHLPAALQARPGVFDVALVPSPTDTLPFAVQFAPVDDAAVEVTDAAPKPVPPPVAAGPLPVLSEPIAPPLARPGSVTLPPPSAPVALPAPSAPTAPRPIVTEAPAVGANRAPRTNPLAVVLLALSLVWWRAAVFVERLRSAPDASGSEDGGLGRFRRKREAAPVPL